MAKIMYPAVPSRLQGLSEQIKQLIRDHGYTPFWHFGAATLEDFEGRIGRTQTLEFLIRVMKCCDIVGVFGISDGVMGELKMALESGQEIRIFYGLDSEWEKYYEELKPKYGDLFARLRGPNHLIALVGPRAIGKTFWSERLLQLYPGRLQRVKNTTTREPRNEKDYESYNFVSREEFEQGIRENRFLEYDEYQGNYYGSSFEEIKRVLRNSSGIFAITPPGVQALYERRFEINLKIINLLPETNRVLRKNFERRGITDPAKQKLLLEEVPKFILPREIEHDFILLHRNSARNKEKLLRLIEPLIKYP